MGRAGSAEALDRLNVAIRQVRALAVAPILRRAVAALRREDSAGCARLALQALARDEQSGGAWYLLAMARERAGDFPNSALAYEAALKLLPDHADIANDLGRLAYRMGMLTHAEKLFRRFIEHAPEKPEGFNNLASIMKDRGERAEAIELLKEAIALHPGSAMLWNTLGSVMVDAVDIENAATFFAEALRLDPKFGRARYNLSQVKLSLGDPAGALADCDVAMRRLLTDDDREMMRVARGSYLLALGRLKEGWADYEARLSQQYSGFTHFAIDRPRWIPGDSLEGKRFLVIAEQGLGDELLFANVLPDVVKRLGPDGKLTLAVEPRLVTLFRRSFPGAEVLPHGTYVVGVLTTRVVPDCDQAAIDLWTPMGSLLQEFRSSIEAFPRTPGYMQPDPARVAHWRRVLEQAPAGLKVGLLWKSATNKDQRQRFFSPFEQWAPVLSTPGVSFVNLQYGDCSAEIAQAERDIGVRIWTPPEIDLKQDLDDVAALSSALDLVIGFSNASFNLAAAGGAACWLLTTPGAWTKLGTDQYPWYPQVRTFVPPRYGEWSGTMAEVAQALRAYAARG